MDGEQSKGGEGRVWIEYEPIDEIARWPRNPKDHDTDGIRESFERFGFVDALIKDERTGRLVSGHGRLDAVLAVRAAGLPPPRGVPLDEAGRWLLPVQRGVSFANEDEAAAYVVATNRLVEKGGWLPEIGPFLASIAATPLALVGTGFTADDLAKLLGQQQTPADRPSMADRFIVPPFSILDARQGYWQERKAKWIALGIRGELGREADDGERTPADPHPAGVGAGGLCGQLVPELASKAQRKGKGKSVGLLSTATRRAGYGADYDTSKGENAWGGARTSVFDPVLCELVYRWFTPTPAEGAPAPRVLDPFAGEATKGIVATVLGLGYTGVELRAEQVQANEAQAREVTPGSLPSWICGDAARLGELVPAGPAYDLIFTSPPYYDLEIYSASEKDGSAFATYEGFMRWYRLIFEQAVARLREDRFLVVKVGEIRDKKNGAYRTFVPDNVACMRELGLHYYNEAILITAVGSLPVRAGKLFQATRKLGKAHQNVLVFYKGDPRHVGRHFKELDVHADGPVVPE
jgi:hypothetical protein